MSPLSRKYMDIVNLFENVFWEVATNMAYLIMPLISITLIIKIIYYFIIKGTD